MRRIRLAGILLICVLLASSYLFLFTSRVSLSNVAVLQSWTAPGVVKETVFCPDGMVFVPEKLEVDDAQLWSDGIIRFRAVCENAWSSKTLTGKLLVDLTWRGWKNVAGGWSEE